jgi:hypothetical protein
MSSRLHRWLRPRAEPPPRAARTGLRCRHLLVEELESRLAPSAAALPANVAVTTEPGVQQMPSVAVDPHDAAHLVVAYLDYSLPHTGYAGIGVAVSHDAGGTWQHTSVALPAGFDQGAAAPVARFDAQGRVFVSFAAATFLGPKPALTDPAGGAQRTLGFQADNGVFVARSNDGGLTWDQPTAVVATRYDGQHPVNFDIKPDLAIDTFPTLPDGQLNPNYGNFYVVWSRFYAPGQFPGDPTSTGGSDILFAISRDEGQSWQVQLQPQSGSSVPQPVIFYPDNHGTGNPAGSGFVNWSHVTVGAEGDVYVSLYLRGSFAVYRSTDGGGSFVGPDYSGTRGLPFGRSNNSQPGSGNGLPIDSFRQNVVRDIVADPSRPGTVYAAEAIGPVNSAGKAIDPGDVAFARSSDQGQTWQATVQLGGRTARVLNDDNSGQITQGLPDDVVTGQALPRMAVDVQGDIVLIWYDTRRDPAGKLLDVFATVSTDGGQTFSPNFRLTNVSLDPNAGAFTDAAGSTDYYLGDSISLAVVDGTAYAAWTDTRGGKQSIEFTSFALDPAPAALNDRFEPNDTPATATDLGPVVNTHLPKLAIPTGDQDWFRVQTTSSGNLTVSATQEESGVGPRLELYDPGGTTLLASGTDVQGAGGRVIGQRIVFPTVPNQTYLVRVLPGTGAVAGGPSHYALDVQSLTADLGSQVHGVVTKTLAVGDNDYYRLAVAAAGSLEVRLTPGPSLQGSVQLNVRDSKSLAVLASGSGTTVQTASLAVQPGQVVLLQVVGAAGGHGSFTLEFANLDQFATPRNTSLLFPAGQGPSEEAVADLTGNGRMDIVVSDAQSNTVSVLLNNGDGTFQAPRQYGVGAYTVPIVAQSLAPNLGRGLVVADVNGDGIPDIIVTNYASADISVLLGRGDGTFEPQRRYDATAGPFALAVGDLNGDGIPDLVVVSSTGSHGKIAVLLGRGDGSFKPPLLFDSPLTDQNPLARVRLADLTGNGRLDLLLASLGDPNVHVLLGNGDGTFRAGPSIPLAAGALAVADLNHDGIPDVVETYFNDTVSYELGRGDGTFQNATTYMSGQDPFAVAVADFGSVVNQGGTVTLGPPDGIPDLLVAASGISSAVLSGPPQVLFYPGQVDSHGKFKGFGAPLVLATPNTPIDIQVADFDGDGTPDIAVVEQGGVRIIYGKPPPIKPNDTPQTARNLGTVVHLVEPALTIVPGHEDAYYTLTVPTEAVPGAGDEVLDFSGLFRATEGAGISLEVRDAAGRLLGSGERFRATAPQGATLSLHVFGVPLADGSRGAGAYTLDIDALPQVVSVQAEPLLPGVGPNPGGPTTSLVVTLQGDRLDPATAEDPANYTVTWFGPDGLPDTAADRAIPVAAAQGAVYDASTNVDVASGNTYPTAVRQTVTLLFDQPLPPGSYRIDLAPAILTAAFNDQESQLLSSRAGFTGHPVVFQDGGQVSEGGRIAATDLVFAGGPLGDLGVFPAGTPFLTQLHDDLGALLDAALTRAGDDPAIPGAIDRQILERFAPALGPADQRPVAVLVIWLDPPPIHLLDPRGERAVFDLQDNSLHSTIQQGFVSVAGNVETLVLAFVPVSVQNYLLALTDVPPTARGGAVYLGRDGTEVRPLTADLRAGVTQFRFSYGQAAVSLLSSPAPPQGPAPDSASPKAPPAPADASTPAPPGGPPPGPTASPVTVVFSLGTRLQSAPVTAIAPRLDPPVAVAPPGPGSTPSPAADGNLVAEVANSGGSAATPPPDPLDVLVQGVRSLLGGVGRPFRGVVGRVRTWFRGLDARLRGLLKALDVQIPAGNNPPAPAPPERDGLPPDQPEEEAEPLALEADDAGAAASEDSGRPADASLAAALGAAGACAARGDARGSRVTRRRQRAGGDPTYA